jgi:hypothetical protein
MRAEHAQARFLHITLLSATSMLNKQLGLHPDSPMKAEKNSSPRVARLRYADRGRSRMRDVGKMWIGRLS